MATIELTTTIGLPNDVIRKFYNPYERNENLGFVKNQIFFQEIPRTSDSLLFERITEQFSTQEGVVIEPERKPSVQLHHNFVYCWNAMQNDERANSICHRAYWLGDSWPTDKIDPKLVSDYLVKTLAERVKRFKKNITMNLLIPYSANVAAKMPGTYEHGEPYQDWFYGVKGESKYDWNVVNAFAKGEKVEPILNEHVFCYTTDVLTASEIERVYAEIKANPEPRTEIKGKVDHVDKFDKLAEAVGALVDIQMQNTVKQKKGTSNE